MQGSSIAAEQRMQELELRCERALGPVQQQGALDGLTKSLHKQFKEPDFKALAASMQNQMYDAAFDDGKNDKESSPFDMTMLQSLPGSLPKANEEMGPEMQLLMQGLSGKPVDYSPGTFINKTVNPLPPKSMVPVVEKAAPKMTSELLPGAYTNKVTEADLPVDGRISSHYGDRTHPVNGHHHFHSGVDIAAPLGSAIKAPWDGKVVYVGNVSGFGANTVIMAHPETAQKDGKIVYSIFGHNHSVNVAAGDTVAKGDSFATVGSEGRSTGPHLHWETRLAEPGLQGKDIFKEQISMTVNPLKFV